MVSSNKIKKFQQKVLKYYQEKGRALPWRQTTNPYFILLSEIMLQQTQVDRGITYYDKWTKKWPTVQQLAKANRITVLKMWMGLGYNNRAINLHKAAQLITDQYNGNVIEACKDYKNVPGIGPYTSAAVQIFANNEDIITVDTNIRRILIHEFNLNEKISDNELWELAEKCLPKGKSRDWHNALMDYGATLLTARKTGIKPKTKQSKFEGSDRQIRAKILRMLLVNPIMEKSRIKKNFQKESNERLQKILQQMEKAHIIETKKNQVKLKK